jgi:hypothetical protein
MSSGGATFTGPAEHLACSSAGSSRPERTARVGPCRAAGTTYRPRPSRIDAAGLAALAARMRSRGHELACAHLAAQRDVASTAGDRIPDGQPESERTALCAELAAELVRCFDAVRSSWPTHGAGSRLLLRAFFDGYRSAGGPARLSPPH